MLCLHSLELGETSPDGLSIDAVLPREIRLVRSCANASPHLFDVRIRELWLRSHTSSVPRWDVWWDIMILTDESSEPSVQATFKPKTRGSKGTFWKFVEGLLIPRSLVRFQLGPYFAAPNAA